LVHDREFGLGGEFGELWHGLSSWGMLPSFARPAAEAAVPTWFG
jgi:hypothetical protein